VHGIRCHCSQRAATYSYPDAQRNIIIAQELFATRLLGHPFKYETHRLGLENSEDALTWNVFRSLQEARCLHEIAHWLSGEETKAEPYLFLWGLCLTDDSLQPWDLLIAARERFESDLPVRRPLTEPDIALYLPGHYLILIEAKFTSPNPYYTDGPRKDAESLTKTELLAIYQDSQLRILDVERARNIDKVYYQLWRNLVFAEWMARSDGQGTRAYHANLTRAGCEKASCAHFRRLLRPGYAKHFVQLAWEEIYARWANRQPTLTRLGRYLATKTTGLVAAFQVHSTAPES
jgi:hypothetical protein